MDGWTIVLLAADVVGVSLTVAYARLRYRDDPSERRLWLGRAAYTGPLIALIAVRAPHLGGFLTVVLVGIALVPALTRRWAIAMSQNPDYADEVHWRGGGLTRGELFGSVPAYLAIMLVIGLSLFVAPNDPKTIEEADSKRFGLDVSRHTDGVAIMLMQRPPTIADADVAGASAVPVERYALDGKRLTLLVRHNGLCEPRLVLLAAVAGVLDVVVAYAKGPAVRSDPSCHPDPSSPGVRRSTVDVALPAGLTFSSVHDVGAEGPATLVTAPPISIR